MRSSHYAAAWWPIRLLLFTVVAALAIESHSATPYRNLRPHSGDGTFRDTSWRSGLLWISGYTITFPEFNLNTEYETTFALANLSNIRRDAGIYLCVDNAGRKWNDTTISQLEANFQFQLADSTGGIVAQLDVPLKSLVWSTHSDTVDALYQLDKSFFRPDPQQRYTLHVHYTPDSKFGEAKGFIHMRCGGHH